MKTFTSKATSHSFVYIVATYLTRVINFRVEGYAYVMHMHGSFVISDLVERKCYKI